MNKFRLAAAVPVLLALVLAMLFHQTASASQPRATHVGVERAMAPTQTQVRQYDIEGDATWCADRSTNCTGYTPYYSGFRDCGADNPGCTEAWVNLTGPGNGNRAGRPSYVSAGCGNSYVDGNGIMHFKYASLRTSTKIVGAAFIVGDTGERNVDTQVFMNVSASGNGTSGNNTPYATSMSAITVHNSQENLAHVNNASDSLLAGGFKITFTGVIDSTISGESGSGNRVETYQPNGTITCTIDTSNNNFDALFEGEVE